jgi:hypothetical protein
MAPHMHVRGKSFQVVAQMKGSPTHAGQTLLDVPNYDFNWQHSYLLKHPLQLSSVKSLQITAVFDNSADNPVNPDPEQHVTWGDQTWEEMAIAFFEVAEPRRNSNLESEKPESSKTQARQSTKSSRELEADRHADVVSADFIKRFDTNGDGEVHRDELPRSIRKVGWSKIAADRDGNERLTREELRAAARRRYLKK